MKTKQPIKTQKQIVYEFLKTRVCTASMITEYIGIAQKNICRFKRELEKDGLLMEVNFSKCKVTGFRAWYITTDRNQFPKERVEQLPIPF